MFTLFPRKVRFCPIFIDNLYVNLDFVDAYIDIIYTYNLYWCRLNKHHSRFPIDLQQLYVDEVALGIH